jgi:hypothetical protein
MAAFCVAVAQGDQMTLASNQSFPSTVVVGQWVFCSTVRRGSLTCTRVVCPNCAVGVGRRSWTLGQGTLLDQIVDGRAWVQ